MGLAKCHFWQKTEKSYYCFLARAAEGEGMVTFALASAVIFPSSEKVRLREEIRAKITVKLPPGIVAQGLKMIGVTHSPTC